MAGHESTRYVATAASRVLVAAICHKLDEEDVVQNPVRDQWKPIFGAMYRRLTVADDWEKISDQQRAERLREAMAAEDKMYGRPPRFSEDFDFVAVVRDLAIP